MHVDSFQFESVQNEKGTLVCSLSGHLDGHGQFPTPFSYHACQKIVFDLDRLRFISSAGIKKWIHFMESLSHDGSIKVEFVNCPKIIIDFVNSIEGFLPVGAEVVSVQVPYFCEDCDLGFTVPKSTSALKSLGKKGLDNYHQEPKVQCPNCAQKAELEVVAGSFFRFLKVDR